MTYEPTLQSVRQHEVPKWFQDAKIGIFVHWGPFTIPAFAPIGRGNINEILVKEGAASFFKNIPYSEWYLNSLRIPGSPVSQRHTETYGSDYSYFDFYPQFKEAAGAVHQRQWDPENWADLFREAGAGYVVLVTKHHEGFLMWPSQTPNYRWPGYQSERDIVGELTEAVKARGMRMGVYYSSLLDWSLTDKPMTDPAGLVSEGGPIDEAYLRYQYNHWRELIDRYEPAILWNDIGFPPGANLYELFAYFYNKVPDGAVNDRWTQLPRGLHRLIRTPVGRALFNWAAKRVIANGTLGTLTPPHCDFLTPEFKAYPEIREVKWESCRGMANGFGYNRMEKDEDYLKLPELIRLLVDIVSKNGNLLLNVGPMADGTIPEVQVNLLKGLGAWLREYGEAVYGTRPWRRAEGVTAQGMEVRFTQKGDSLYAFILGRPGEKNVLIKDVPLAGNIRVYEVKSGTPLEFRQEGADLVLNYPQGLLEESVQVVRIRSG